MALRRLAAITVAILMATPMGMTPLASAQTGAPVRVIHSPVGCMVANQFPQLEASAPPGATVDTARAYFRSSLSGDWYYVEGTPSGNGRFLFVLPAPRLEASPITYYIEFQPSGRTEDYTAIVVDSSGDCGDRAPAAIAPSGPAAVFGPGGVTAVAPGFGVVAAGGGAVVAGAGISKGLLFAAGALAIGVGVAIALSGDDPSPSPAPQPTPTPAPQPTPTPAPQPTPTPTPAPQPRPTPTPLPTPPPVSPFR